jgi:hypothetical protein
MILALLLALAAGDTVINFSVYPAEIHLDDALDSQRIVVIGDDYDSSSIDLTADSIMKVVDESIASFRDGVLTPLADGETSLKVHSRGQSRMIPIKVSNSNITPDVSFKLDVVPIFTAAGCNAGTCHGQAKGKDGFHLSLFGYDPDGDHKALTEELPGRRLNFAFPASSLLLEKVAGAVPHTGGRLLEPEGREYELLRRWIEKGAPADPKIIPKVTRLELLPPDLLLRGPERAVQLIVRAHYSDGTDRDVTDSSILRTSNDVSAALSNDGVVRSGVPGEAFVTASYDVHTVGTAVTVIRDAPTARWHDSAEGIHPANYVDEFVEQKLRRLRMKPSGICNDETFLRRVYIDIVGALPSQSDRAAFLADKSTTKRAELIDQLLDRKEFAEIWVMQWAELLRIRSNNDISEKAALLYFEWIRDRIAENLPVDEMVRQILGASGGTFSNPPTNFYQVERDDLVLSENIAQAFLGIRIQCAKCHNHPFDRWTQDDYYGFAAFVSQVGRKAAEDPRERIIFDKSSGQIRHPVSDRVMKPAFLGGEMPDLEGRDRRHALAEWITSGENPWFARSLANRVWAYFMGPGIVEPVDDFRVSNPPSNAALLDELSLRLVSYDFDFKQLVRDITNSRSYQRDTVSNDTNRDDLRNTARFQVRRVRAETLLDLYCQATGVPQKFNGLPLGARAIEIADGATTNYFLKTFGRSERGSVCACEVTLEPSLSQALHLLNGDVVHKKITEGDLITRWVEVQMTPTQVLTEMYLLALCREPNTAELNALLTELGEAPDKSAYEDTLWALLNSREFLFQH